MENTTVFPNRCYQWAKSIGSAVIWSFIALGAAYANLDQELTKVNTLVTGKFASMVLIGGLIVGGTNSLIKQNLWAAICQLCIACLIGLFVWMVQTGRIFGSVS